MSTYYGTFTSGLGPDATYQWSTQETQDQDGNWYVQVFCNYGGGDYTNNQSQTDPIPWDQNGDYAMYQTTPNDAIVVSGTVTVNFDATGGSDYVAVFNGTMTLTGSNSIGASGIVVAASVSETN